MTTQTKQKPHKIIGILIALVLIVVGYYTSDKQDVSARSSSATQQVQATTANNSLDHSHWSKTNPAINQQHVFFGEINRKGKPTGYHSRPNGKDPKSARVIKVKSHPNNAGVYTAEIEVYDASQKRWKSKFSSFFPDSLNQQGVIKAIAHAYKNRNKKKDQPWSGPSGLGFNIQGYLLRNGKINTAFPVYKRD